MEEVQDQGRDHLRNQHYLGANSDEENLLGDSADPDRCLPGQGHAIVSVDFFHWILRSFCSNKSHHTIVYKIFFFILYFLKLQRD